MDPIEKAIEDIESREAGDNFSYRRVAKKIFPKLTERRCRGGTKAKRARMQPKQNASYYSTHNKSRS
jgi:hypothetical protein